MTDEMAVFTKSIGATIVTVLAVVCAGVPARAEIGRAPDTDCLMLPEQSADGGPFDPAWLVDQVAEGVCIDYDDPVQSAADTAEQGEDPYDLGDYSIAALGASPDGWTDVQEGTPDSPGPLALGAVVPCWVTEDECTGDYRLPLGQAYGAYRDTGRVANPTAYYVDGRCGDEVNVGRVPDLESLVVYVPHSYALDEVTDDGGDVKFEVDLYEHSSGSCAGRVTRNFTADTATCQLGMNDTDMPWNMAWADGKIDCAGDYSDPVSCHLPDILVDYPGSPGTYAYSYYIKVYVCNFDGSNCTTDTETGCFQLEWYVPAGLGSEGDALLTSSIGTIWDVSSSSLARPCWASLDPCTDDYRIMVGSAYGRFFTSRVACAETSFKDGACGNNHDAGDIPNNQGLLVFFEHAYGIDSSTSDGGVVQFSLDVDEWTIPHGVTPCTGTVNRTFTADEVECTVSGAYERTWQAPWSDAYGDCSGGYWDPGDCHLPDVLVSYPGTTGAYCYKVTMVARTCDADGTDCTTDTEYGQFVLEWVAP